MVDKFNIPILLIGFNRPDLTLRVIDSMRSVQPQKIYFAVDGSRNGEDTQKVTEVKNMIREISWNCKVVRKFSKKNYGCKYGPVRAMDWFFAHEKMGIILEDDVIADESFFYFCDKLLKMYEHNTKIGSISGNNFQFNKKRGSSDYYFSRYSHSCGWATWKRSWLLYDIEMGDYKEKGYTVLNKTFKKMIDKIYWKLIFDGIQSKEIDSAWDYQWNWMMWKNDMLGIIPNNNLVKNIGFGRNDATHTKYKSKFENMVPIRQKFPLIHPKNIQRDAKADDFTQKNNYVLWKEVGMRILKKYIF